jgi:hypothetical protein
MARLDDEELKISPEVAAALGYPVRRANAARPIRNPRAPAQPRHANNQGDGFGLFEAFGVAVLLGLIICTAVGITGYVSRVRSADSHPQTSAHSPEGQSVADPQPAAQPQAPPAIQTANLNTDSQQIIQSPPQPESVPNSVEASSSSDPSSAEPVKPEITVAEAIQEDPVRISQPPESGEERHAAPPSWRWVCEETDEDRTRCGLLDVHGTYVEIYEFDGQDITSSPGSPDALRPRAWGCEKNDHKLYCTIQDGQGHILQGCLYDGTTLDCGN